MVSELSLKAVLAALFLCILFSCSLYAQEVNYRVDVRYIQRLTWVGDEYTMRYEVIIERYENRRYSNFFRDFTEKEFIEVSLPPGNYRYQVIPYDYLNVPIQVTEWSEFEILKASPSILAEGGEPEDSSAGADKFDIYFGAAYLPLLPVYGGNIFFGENLSLAGAGLKIGMVSAQKGFISPGAELNASWRMEDGAQPEQRVQLITVELDFIGQIRFLNGSGSSRTALNFRAGAGVSLFSDTQNESMPKLDIFYLNMGISFLALVTRNLYIEAGADIPQFLSVELHGYFRPFIGIGARF